VSRRPRQRLDDILEAASIAATIAARGRPDFDGDPVVRMAAEALVTRIGEASRHLPEEITALAPEVPWPQIRGMRNVLTHAYFDIEPDVLWTTIIRDIQHSPSRSPNCSTSFPTDHSTIAGVAPRGGQQGPDARRPGSGRWAT
jgi:uncharacterized protein with HEPN domain